MKTTLFFITFLTLLISVKPQSAFAQQQIADQPFSSFKAGSWQVTGKAGYGRGDLLRNRIGYQLQGGYYLLNRLLLGVNATKSREWLGEFNFSDLTAGPYARYHFTSSRLSPFVDATYQFGRRTSGENSNSLYYTKVDVQTTQFTAGVSYGLTKSIRAEVSYGLQWIFFSSHTPTYGQPQIGLTYLFNK